MHGGLHEEAHEAELDAVLLLEALLVAVAQFDHRLHVDLVERGQDRGGGLRLHEPFGDPLAQARHRYALLRTVAEVEAHRRRFRRGSGLTRGRRGSRGRRGGRRTRIERSEHVALGDASAATGSLRDRDVVLGHELAGRRQGLGRRLRARRVVRRRRRDGLVRRGRRLLLRRGRPCRGRLRRLRRRRGRRCALRFGVEHGNDVVRRDRGAVGLQHFDENAVGGRRQLEDDLVRLDVDQVLVALDRVAGLLVPAHERRFRDRLRKLRDLDFNSHRLFLDV